MYVLYFLSLPRLAKLMFAVAIFLSFALQGYITIEVCWRRYSEYMNLKQSHPLEYVLRIAIVLGAGSCLLH